MRAPYLMALALGLSFTGCGRTLIFPIDGGDSFGSDASGGEVSDGNDEWAETAGDDWSDETSGDDWSEDTGDDGGVVCPDPGGAWVDWYVEAPIPQPAVRAGCDVMESWSEGYHVEIFLECRTPNGQGFPIFLQMDSEVEIWPSIFPGMQVEFQYEQGYPSEWFAIHNPSRGMLLGGMKAESPWSWQGVVDYRPLELDLIESECQPYENECGLAQPLGLFAAFWESTAAVYPGEIGYVGELESFQIVVSQAWQMLELWCDDYPETWIQAVFVEIPEG